MCLEDLEAHLVPTGSSRWEPTATLLRCKADIRCALGIPTRCHNNRCRLDRCRRRDSACHHAGRCRLGMACLKAASLPDTGSRVTHRRAMDNRACLDMGSSLACLDMGNLAIRSRAAAAEEAVAGRLDKCRCTWGSRGNLNQVGSRAVRANPAAEAAVRGVEAAAAASRRVESLRPRRS